MNLLNRNRERASELERIITERINSFYLIERKSSEIFVGNSATPLPATPEVRSFANHFLENNEIDVTKEDSVTGWDRFWAQEMATVMTAVAFTGVRYPLPGRALHYELLANTIDDLFNVNGHNNGYSGIEGRKVVELGSGSGLSLMMLAQKGAKVVGLDSSLMAGEFARYLAKHYRVADKVEIVRGDYFHTEREDKEFDAVYNSGVFEHFNEAEARELLREMIRITKPQGYVIISIPNENSPFYRSFKEREKNIKSKFPDIIEIPVEHSRYHLDPSGLMVQAGLTVVKQDGIQVAPSSPIKPSDISRNNPNSIYDLAFFHRYLPEQADPLSVDNKVANWSRLEQNASTAFRMRYGWSRVYAAQKPAD